MVDFKKINDDWYNGLNSEQRKQVDERRAREAESSLTEREITAKFTRLTAKKNGELAEVKTWNKPVTIRIENGVDHTGKIYERISFKNAVTGFENYSLDGMLLDELSNCEEDDAWMICAGSHRYDRCEVMLSDVADYLNEFRPGLLVKHPDGPNV